MEMEQKILATIREAVQNGKRKLRITYRRDALHGLYALMSMVNSRMITMIPGEHVVALAVVMSGNWESDNNRTFTITMEDAFREELFATVMSGFLERISYARPKQLT